MEERKLACCSAMKRKDLDDSPWQGKGYEIPTESQKETPLIFKNKKG